MGVHCPTLSLAMCICLVSEVRNRGPGVAVFALCCIFNPALLHRYGSDCSQQSHCCALAIGCDLAPAKAAPVQPPAPEAAPVQPPAPEAAPV